MRMLEEFKIAWQQLSLWQHVKLVGILVLFAVLMFSGWMDSCRTMREVRKHEREANNAKRDAEDALKSALKIAQERKVLELKLAEIEAKRDEKQSQINDAGRETADARAEYERAVREPRTDNPSTEQLCTELAELGYPCR